MERICSNCKNFVPKQGKFGLGLCISFTSRKKIKGALLKNDTCQKWEGKDEKN